MRTVGTGPITPVNAGGSSTEFGASPGCSGSVVRSEIVHVVPSNVSNASARHSAACGVRTRNATSSDRCPRARRSTTSLNPG